MPYFPCDHSHAKPNMRWQIGLNTQKYGEAVEKMGLLAKIKGHPVLTGISLAILAYSLWALSNTILKWTEPDLSVYSVIFWNDLFALIVICALHKQLGGFKETFKTPSLKYHLLRAFFYSLNFIALIYAMTLMPMANAYSILFSAPLITAVLAIIFLKEKTHPFHWISIIAGLTGVLIVLQPDNDLNTLGIILALSSALFVALGNIANCKISANDTRLSFGFYAILSTLAISGILSLSDFQFPSPIALVLLAIAGAFAAFGVIFLGKAFTQAPSATITPFMYTQIVWVVLLDYLIFGDVLSVWTTLGSLVIIGSGLYLIYNENKRTKPR